jgi:1-acyl-sn-glycerol-3-phosphate acyltransferase
MSDSWQRKEIFDNKLAGPLMRGMHHINVDRSNGSPSFVAALRALKSGEIVGIFPEGTISTSFEIKGLKSGAVRLAIGAGVPIIPTIVWGGQRVYTKGVKPSFRDLIFQYLFHLEIQFTTLEKQK